MEARRTFANHPDTTRDELAAWEEWLWTAKRRPTLLREAREDLLPTIREWMRRRSQDPRQAL